MNFCEFKPTFLQCQHANKFNISELASNIKNCKAKPVWEETKAQEIILLIPFIDVFFHIKWNLSLI